MRDLLVCEDATSPFMGLLTKRDTIMNDNIDILITGDHVDGVVFPVIWWTGRSWRDYPLLSRFRRVVLVDPTADHEDISSYLEDSRRIPRSEEDIVLVIMVKNEGHSIARTLRPFIEKGVARFLVFDTGSTDDTIARSHDLFNMFPHVVGRVYQELFQDFATSRNRALDTARQLFEDTFMLMIDAEWSVEGVDVLIRFCRENRESADDCFFTTVRNPSTGVVFQHKRLIRREGAARFVGVVHEYVDGSGGASVPDGFYLMWTPSTTGAKQSADRYYRDLGLLLKEVETDPSADRAVFYLGQTYDCLGDVENAIRYYKKRSEIKTGFVEEIFMALYRIGILLESQGRWPEAMDAFIRAYEMRPARIEPLVRIAMHYPNPHVKYMFAHQACTTDAGLHDMLFVEKDMYDYHRWDQLGIGSWYMGRHDEGIDAVNKALRVRPDTPHLLRNLMLHRNSLSSV